jgi:prevent-host-death family protein
MDNAVASGYAYCMTITIPQRQLRNQYAEVIREVRAGEVYLVTDRGQPVARISPVDAPGYSRAAPAGTAASIPRVSLAESTASILDELRGEQ